MGRPLRVLIVEDSEDDVQLVLREIRKAGYEPTYERVDTAPAMKAALEKQTWDLVLADYNMPEFSGPGALELLKEEGLDLPFILVSGAIGEEAAVAVMKAGAHDFAKKDALARLGPAIERELHEVEVRRERRKAEEALLESEERYRSLFENMMEGLAYCRMIFEDNQPQDFIYLHVNRKFEELTGLKDVVGKKVTEVIPGIREANPELFEIYGRVSLTGKPERFEVYLDALKIWLFISVYSPKKEYFVAVFDNITERKKAEDEIRHLKEFNEEIVQQMEGGIMRLDGDLRIIFLNPKALSMLGYEKGELKGEPYETICRDRGECQEHLREMNEKMRPIEFECTLNTKDGRELTILNSCTPLFRDGKLTGYISTLLDITEWKAMEEEYTEKGLKYDLEKGKLYLSEETEAGKAMDAFQDLLKAGYGGMVITRRHPEEVREEHQLGKEVPLYWLAAEASAEASVLQPEFPVIEKEIRAFLGRRRVLLLDRLEYLVSQRGFEETLAFVQRVHELAYAKKGVVLFSLDPATFPPHQLALFRSETRELERKEEPAIPEDLLEILQFVYQENREGRKPTHKATSKRFGFSRMTRLRKISQLKALGLIADEPKGRMKVLWVTEKGKDLL